MKSKVSAYFRSQFSLILCAVLVFVCLPLNALAANDTIGNYEYTISNPYAAVNFDTWKAYRGATHVHTVRSDGNIEVDDMIENYYAAGYQCLALTDHGTVNYSWHKNQTRLAIFGYQFFVHGNVDELTDERYNQITTGSDRNGDPMIEIPLGIELNGSSTKKCHVNSYFADCGHGDLEISATWPEDAVKKCQNAGGICHINHVGEWTDGKDNIGTYDSAFVTKYSKLFLNYSSCIGMELVNTTDNRTHNDRYLYDETLKITMPQGKPVWGFCEDDSHDPEDIGNNAQFFYMPQNTAANVRTCMETGAFFACSKNAKTSDELGNGFSATGDFPMVSRVEVDEGKNQITFYPYNANVIKMVSDGNIIDTKTVNVQNSAVTFDLNDYESQLGSYARFFITGAGGICYSQPFGLTKKAYSKSTVKFVVSPAEATTTVYNQNNEIVEPANNNNEYILPIGRYRCVFENTDFLQKTENIVISDNSTRLTRNIVLEKPGIFSKNTTKLEINHENRFLFALPDGNPDISQYIRTASGVTVSEINVNENGPGTGSTLTVSSVYSSTDYTLIRYGDLTGDGICNGEDAVILSALTAGMFAPVPPAEYPLAGDCNHSGSVNSEDVSLIINTGVYNASITMS